MLKRFFVSFLGSIAGFWVSMMVCFVSFILLIIILSTSGSGYLPVENHSVLYINLSGEVVDRPSQADLLNELYYGGTDNIALSHIVKALEAAADDDRIEGVYIDCNGAYAGLASSQAIVTAIDKFKKSGKWVYAYADDYTQGNYFIACHADSVFMNPIGSVDIHGLSATTPYFKNLLDTLGVEVQVVKVGTYKSAVEPYILEDMSEASREQQEHYLGNMWETVKKSIADARNIKPSYIDSLANNFIGLKEADASVKAKLVDRLVYRHSIEDLLMSKTGAEVIDDLNVITVSDYCKGRGIPVPDGDKNIAIIYAIGDINDSGTEGIVTDAIVTEILNITDNEDIDGLIMRVNSPGGSAFASEQIWEALQNFKKETGKPFFVSMGDYAASGGYYISCGADCIYAEPLTLTGSIGIFGLIPNIKGTLHDKLGVNTSTVQTNPNANFPTILEPMTPAQQNALQANVERGYELFLKRVSDGRKMPLSDLRKIAEGRVWDGATAKELGLVDKLGGLDMAIRDMAKKIGAEDNYSIEEYPAIETMWWEDMFSVSAGGIKTLVWGQDNMLDNMDPEMLRMCNMVSKIKSMNPLQCRMEPVVIK